MITMSVFLISILCLAIFVSANHATSSDLTVKNAKILDARCPTPAEVVLNPSVVVISEENNPSKYRIRIPIKNIGVEDWKNEDENPDDVFKLKIIAGPQDLRNAGYINLGTQEVKGVHTSSGETAIFETPELTAPTTAGNVRVEFRMVKQSVLEEGESAVDIGIGVKCIYDFTIVKLDSLCQNIGTGGSVRIFDMDLSPYSISTAGDHEVLPTSRYEIRVKLKNTGTSTWNNNDYEIEGKIGTETTTIPLLKHAQGMSENGQLLTDPNLRISPNGIYLTGDILLTPPTTPGSYPVEWQMKLKSINKKFGEVCRGNLIVTGINDGASCGANAQDNGITLSPIANSKGQGLRLDLRMKNTGNTVWRSGVLGQGYSFKGIGRSRELGLDTIPINLPQNRKIRPNEVATSNPITLDLTLPSMQQRLDNAFGEVGSYHLKFTMVKAVN